MGLEPGDEIVAVGGTPVEPEEISQTIRESEGESLTLTVDRAGEDGRPRPPRPRSRPTASTGSASCSTPCTRATASSQSFRLAIEETWFVTKAIFGSLGRIVTGSGRDEVSSPIGIVQGSSQALDEGFRVYLRILAFISLSLALLNLLPLLPLDGGHIAMSIAEKVRGRAIPRVVYERISAVGIAVVLLLFVIGLSNDIGRLNGG